MQKKTAIILSSTPLESFNFVKTFGMKGYAWSNGLLFKSEYTKRVFKNQTDIIIDGRSILVLDEANRTFWIDRLDRNRQNESYDSFYTFELYGSTNTQPDQQPTQIKEIDS